MSLPCLQIQPSSSHLFWGCEEVISDVFGFLQRPDCENLIKVCLYNERLRRMMQGASDLGDCFQRFHWRPDSDSLPGGISPSMWETQVRRINAATLRSAALIRKTLTEHTREVTSVQMSSDERRAISGSWDLSIKIWDLESGRCLQTLRGHTALVTSVQLSSDQMKAISGSDDGSIKIWNLESGLCLQTLTGHTASVTSVQLSSDQMKAISGSTDNSIKMWNLESGLCLQTLREHTGSVISLQMSADGMRAISGSWDRSIKIWDLGSGLCLQTLIGHTNWVGSVQMSADGMRAISGASDRSIKIWDLGSGLCLQTLTGHTNPILSVQMSPDERKAISGSWDRSIKIWDLGSGLCLQTLTGHTRPVTSVQMSADGMRAISGSNDSSIKIWNLGSLPEERLSAAAQAAEIVPEVFNSLPEFVRNRLFYLTYLIHRQKEDFPCDPPFNYGELAFLNQKGYSTTSEERQWALDYYAARFFLSDVAQNFSELEAFIMSNAESFESIFSDSLDGEAESIAKNRQTEHKNEMQTKHKNQETARRKAAFEHLNRFSQSLRNRVYAALYEIHVRAGKALLADQLNYGEAAFRGECDVTVTDRERAEAISCVRSMLLREKGIEEPKF